MNIEQIANILDLENKSYRKELLHSIESVKNPDIEKTLLFFIEPKIKIAEKRESYKKGLSKVQRFYYDLIPYCYRKHVFVGGKLKEFL